MTPSRVAGGIEQPCHLFLIAGAVELRLHRVGCGGDLTERERGRKDLSKDRFHGRRAAPALYFEEPTGKRRREVEFQFPRDFSTPFREPIILDETRTTCRRLGASR